MLGFLVLFSYISKVIMSDMNKLLKYCVYGVCTTLLIGVVLAIPPAIKFFFRGFLLLFEFPLEAFCFFGLLLIGYSLLIWIENQEESEKKLQNN